MLTARNVLLCDLRGVVTGVKADVNVDVLFPPSSSESSSAKRWFPRDLLSKSALLDADGAIARRAQYLRPVWSQMGLVKTTAA